MNAEWSAEEDGGKMRSFFRERADWFAKKYLDTGSMCSFGVRADWFVEELCT